MTIDDIRNGIDRFDDELLRIFNQRAALASKLRDQENPAPVYDPDREKIFSSA
jgi:chorismate mutase